MAPLASACRKPIGEQIEKLKMGVDTHQQVSPRKQIETAPLAGSLKHLRRQLPPGGSYGLLPCNIGCLFLRKCQRDFLLCNDTHNLHEIY